MKTNRIIYILPIALGLVACEPEFDDVDFNGGSADFSSFVSVGNSLTAGYQSGALSAEGQEYSLPAMIAGQIQASGIGSTTFNQPILPGQLGELGAGFSVLLAPTGELETRLALKATVNCIGEASIGPVRKGDNYAGLLDLISDVSSQEYNNQGVPGAKLTDLNNPSYANPYFVRMRTPGQSMLTLATDLNATFFSLWIGNNDVLGYATAGGDDAISIPGVPRPELTSQTDFQEDYNAAIDALTQNGAKGVVANIPNITSIPYFTTVPTGTDALTETQAADLNAAYALYNGGLDLVATANPAFQPEADLRKISFEAGQFNQFVVLDPGLTAIPNLPSIRQIKTGEFLTLVTPGDSLLCAQWGTAKPIPGNFHLTANEVKKITDAIGGYNLTIKSKANDEKLAFVNASAKLSELASDRGITISGINFNSSLVTGGAFSLDGVHPSTRGYAIIANEFIDAINQTYNANISKVDVASYPAFEVEQ